MLVCVRVCMSVCVQDGLLMVDVARTPKTQLPARTWGALEQRQVGARQAWRCANCHECLDELWALDHIHPRHLGGGNELANAQALCSPCHGRKTLKEERERHDAAHAARVAAIEAARAAAIAADGDGGAAQRERERAELRRRRKRSRPREPCPGDVDYVDPLLQASPQLLRFAYLPPSGRVRACV